MRQTLNASQAQKHSERQSRDSFRKNECPWYSKPPIKCVTDSSVYYMSIVHTAHTCEMYQFLDHNFVIYFSCIYLTGIETGKRETEMGRPGLLSSTGSAPNGYKATGPEHSPGLSTTQKTHLSHHLPPSVHQARNKPGGRTQSSAHSLQCVGIPAGIL